MGSALVLVGMPGSGKSTIGRRLAARLERPFIDADSELESRCGVSVATVFEIEGETGFRERETRLLVELLGQPDLVIATGGGVVKSEQNRELLRQHACVIYLQATLGELWNRLRHDRKRPLLQSDNPRQRVADLLVERSALYESVADLTVRSRRQSAEKFTTDIVEALLASGMIDAHNPQTSETDNGKTA